jgi:hypothetical protein
MVSRILMLPDAENGDGESAQAGAVCQGACQGSRVSRPFPSQRTKAMPRAATPSIGNYSQAWRDREALQLRDTRLFHPEFLFPVLAMRRALGGHEVGADA